MSPSDGPAVRDTRDSRPFDPRTDARAESAAVEPSRGRRPRRPPRAPVERYEPGLCKEVVDIMGDGYSLTAFAGHLSVSRGTLDDWIAAHPAFAAAVERGRAARACFLEDQFLDGGTGAKVAAHVFALKNAAPEDWRERPEADGGKPPEVGFIMPENGR